MTESKPLDDLLEELDNLPDLGDEVPEPKHRPVASKINYRDFPVLVVDDEEENLVAFQLNFRDEFDLDVADGGKIALETLGKREYAVIVSDQRMPNMTGVELLEHTVDIYPHLIRIILTGYTDHQSLIDAINVGRIYRYITKPWNHDEMTVTLKRAIEAYALGRENDRLVRELQSKNDELEQIVAERTKELMQANGKLRQLAITDGMTGLFNHRYFQEKWRDEIKRSERYGEPVSLLIMDVDWFKNYNDRKGHPQGDVLLRDLAMLLEQSFREVDVVARYGGEEFAVILPRTNRDDAAVLADRVRVQIETTPFPHRQVQPGGRVTASFGLATFPVDGATASTVIERADQALYAAKQQGRNRVVMYDKNLPPISEGAGTGVVLSPAPTRESLGDTGFEDLPSEAIDLFEPSDK